VTAGANQAFVNIVLSLVDESDSVVLFKPYYFNHIMALQMTGGADRVGLTDWGLGSTVLVARWFGNNLLCFHQPCHVSSPATRVECSSCDLDNCFLPPRAVPCIVMLCCAWFCWLMLCRFCWVPSI
jgi:hypothetical protein